MLPNCNIILPNPHSMLPMCNVILPNPPRNIVICSILLQFSFILKIYKKINQ